MFKIFTILAVVLVLFGILLKYGNNDIAEGDLTTNDAMSADGSTGPRRLPKIPDVIPQVSQETVGDHAAEDLLDPNAESNVSLGWAYEGEQTAPTELLIELRFLELRNSDLPGQEISKELGRIELKISRNRRRGVVPPAGTNAIATAVRTRGFAQLVSPLELTAWPFCQKFDIDLQASRVQELTLRISEASRIAGMVIDERTQAPEAQVDVILFREGGKVPVEIQRTDDSGEFKFESLADGFYAVMTKKSRKFLFANSKFWKLKVRSLGQGNREFRSEEMFFDRTIGDQGALVVRLSEGKSQEGLILPMAGPGRIDGIVRDWMGKVVPDLELTASLPSQFLTRDTVTDANGVFKIPNCVPGNWRISLGRKSQRSQLDWIVATVASESTRVNLELPKPKRVRVIAETVDGAPVPHAAFFLHRRGGPVSESTGIPFPLTNEDGVTELDNVIDRAAQVFLSPTPNSKWLAVGSDRSPMKTVKFGTQDTETLTFQFVEGSRFRAELDFAEVLKKLPEGTKISGFMATFSVEPDGPESLIDEGNHSGEIDVYLNTAGPIFVRSITLYVEGGGLKRCHVPDFVAQPLLKGQKRLGIQVRLKK